MAYFSDYFNVSEDIIKKYGAFDISLINDLPLFIDPFLLFGSKKKKYKKLHDSILKYLIFLKEKSAEIGILNNGQIQRWYEFPEIKQNWLGYSLVGNSGRGLGRGFGVNLSRAMKVFFTDLGHEKITASSHLEKACLFQTGVGRDNISDFTCNLIKSYLLQYTSDFAQKHLKYSYTKTFKVEKVYFDYKLEAWMPREYILPFFDNDFVLLTPKEILTKDESWISANDLHGKFYEICKGIQNSQLREQIEDYFRKKLPKPEPNKKVAQKDKIKAIVDTVNQYPIIADYYIKYQEDDKDGATFHSKEKVSETEKLFHRNVKTLVNSLTENSKFYSINPESTYDESLRRIYYLKNVIEKNDGYKLFYLQGKPLNREKDLQIMYRLTWFETQLDVNSEVNNGRGPVDYKVSSGDTDKTLIEFKLASNSQLEKNLLKQLEIYKEANNTKKGIKVILYFTKDELSNVQSILKRNKLDQDKSIILIDARNDNKPSASKAA